MKIYFLLFRKIQIKQSQNKAKYDSICSETETNLASGTLQHSMPEDNK